MPTMSWSEDMTQSWDKKLFHIVICPVLRLSLSWVTHSDSVVSISVTSRLHFTFVFSALYFALLYFQFCINFSLHFTCIFTSPHLTSLIAIALALAVPLALAYRNASHQRVPMIGIGIGYDHRITHSFHWLNSYNCINHCLLCWLFTRAHTPPQSTPQLHKRRLVISAYTRRNKANTRTDRRHLKPLVSYHFIFMI